MKKQGVIRKAISNYADVPWFTDMEFINYIWTYLRRLLGRILTPAKARHIESFEEAMVRLNLNEQDILQRIKEFSRLSWFFLVIALLSFTYSIYYAALGEMRSTIIGFIITLLVLTRLFHCHFWLFQLKHRKLGCTFKEWYNSTISGE